MSPLGAVLASCCLLTACLPATEAFSKSHCRGSCMDTLLFSFKCCLFMDECCFSLAPVGRRRRSLTELLLPPSPRRLGRAV